MPAREVIASVVFAETFGGTSDPALEAMAETIATSTADAILAALREADEATRLELIRALLPESMVVVPREPTTSMMRAAQAAWLADTQRRTTTLWAAMLAAVEQGNADPR